MKQDLKPLMDEINTFNVNNDYCLGYLPPLIINSSKCQLGALAVNAQSFVERIISAANLVLTKDRSSTTVLACISTRYDGNNQNEQNIYGACTKYKI